MCSTKIPNNKPTHDGNLKEDVREGQCLCKCYLNEVGTPEGDDLHDALALLKSKGLFPCCPLQILSSSFHGIHRDFHFGLVARL